MVTLKQQQDTINDTTINKKQQTKSCVCLLLWTINVNKEAYLMLMHYILMTVGMTSQLTKKLEKSNSEVLTIV